MSGSHNKSQLSRALRPSMGRVTVKSLLLGDQRPFLTASVSNGTLELVRTLNGLQSLGTLKLSKICVRKLYPCIE